MSGGPKAGLSADSWPRRLCRCEARIAAAILDGYACGNPDCWRTEEVAASFEAFVARLKARRDEAPREEGPASG